MTITHNPSNNKRTTVALVFELTTDNDGTVSNEAHLLPNGYFRATDGRPRECAAWCLNADIAQQVISRMSARVNDTLIDYEHQSLNAEFNGQPVIAAGWFKDMAFRDSGLYAINILWTDKARQHIQAKEYRYISAVFSYYEETGEVLDIISAALTNTPALDGLDDLVALSRRTDLLTSKDNAMPEPNTEQIAVLTQERDDLKTKVATLTQENTELETKVTALTSQVKTLEQEKQATAQANEKQQCADLLQAALTSGKVLPAWKPYLEKKTTVADLKEAIDAFAGGGVTEALLTKQHDKSHDTGNHGLTDTELAVCKKMNVSPEDYNKAKEA